MKFQNPMDSVDRRSINSFISQSNWPNAHKSWSASINIIYKLIDIMHYKYFCLIYSNQMKWIWTNMNKYPQIYQVTINDIIFLLYRNLTAYKILTEAVTSGIIFKYFKIAIEL